MISGINMEIFLDIYLTSVVELVDFPKFQFFFQNTHLLILLFTEYNPTSLLDSTQNQIN